MAGLRWAVPVLVFALGFASLGLPHPATAQPVDPAAHGVDRWRTYIAEASARFGIPEEWVRRVMRAESAGRTQRGGRPITSRAGAMGLMQLMPGTWRQMRAQLGLGNDPHEPRDNILAGTAFLRAMYDRFGYPGLFGAYNAGPARYAEHLLRARTLPGETIAYMAAVAGRGGAVSVPASATPLVRRVPPEQPTLFAALSGRPAPGNVSARDEGEAQAGALFVRLRGPGVGTRPD